MNQHIYISVFGVNMDTWRMLWAARLERNRRIRQSPYALQMTVQWWRG